MKLKLYILTISLFISLQLGAQEKYMISTNYSGVSFKEFVTKVESTLPVRFFYMDEWVKDLKIGDFKDCATLSCVMDNVLSGTTLFYYIDDFGNVVITNLSL